MKRIIILLLILIGGFFLTKNLEKFIWSKEEIKIIPVEKIWNELNNLPKSYPEYDGKG